MAQKLPQRIEAPTQSSNPATFIFLHGFGDDADGWTSKDLPQIELNSYLTHCRYRTAIPFRLEAALPIMGLP